MWKQQRVPCYCHSRRIQLSSFGPTRIKIDTMAVKMLQQLSLPSIFITYILIFFSALLAQL